MGFWNLFKLAFVPPLRVLIVSLVGAFLATDYSGIFTASARISLNKLVFYVFTPSLIFGNIAETITFQDLLSWWFMPVNIGIIFFCGAILGWVVVKITKPDPHLEGLIIGSCSAGNLGFLLLIIIPAVCDEDGGPFGDPDICRPLALSYASFSLALAGFYIWTHTYYLIKKSSLVLHENTRSGEGAIDESDSRTFPNRPDSNQTTPLLRRSNLNDNRIQLGWWSKVKEIFAPSTIAAILGLIVGTIPWLKSFIIGEGSPLAVIEDSITLLGEAALPSVTIILGGNLLKGIQKSYLKVSIIINIILVKFVILPLIGIAVVKGASKLGILPLDPLFKYVLMIQFTVPPPMSLGTLVELFRVGREECSVIFLWTYLISAISLTFWSMVYMWILSQD